MNEKERKDKAADLRALIADLRREYTPAELLRCPKCGGAVRRFVCGDPLPYADDTVWKLLCMSGAGCGFEVLVREDDERVAQLCDAISCLLD